MLTKPDLDGRLLAMIKTVADYARESGALESDAHRRHFKVPVMKAIEEVFGKKKG